MKKDNDTKKVQNSSVPKKEKAVYGWFRFGTDHGYWIYDSVEELERETGMVGLSKELTYGLWIDNEESDMTATLLSTFEECPFMGEQILYSKRRGFYKYNPDEDYPPEAFIGYCHWFSGIPLEEENDYELMRTIFYGERLQSDQHNEIDDVFGELCDFSSPDDSGGTPV